MHTQRWECQIILAYSLAAGLQGSFSALEGSQSSGIARPRNWLETSRQLSGLLLLRQSFCPTDSLDTIRKVLRLS